MPRNTTRPGPPSILLGVWGQGETAAENIAALLNDYVDGLDGDHTIRVLIPLDKDLTTNTVMDVEALATENQWEVQVITTAAPRVKVLREIKEAASKVIDSSPETIEEDFVKTLQEARDARLLFLWDEDADGDPNEDDQRLLYAVADAGIQALDLTQGLEVLDVEEGEETTEKEPEPEETPEPPKKATGRGRAVAKEPEPEPEETPAEGDEGPSEEEIRGWSERRLRSYAIECDLDKDEAAKMKKDALLAWIFEEEAPEGEAEPEPEPEVKPTRSRTTKARETAEEVRGGRETREDIEEDGGKANSGATRRARASKAAEPTETPDEAQAGVSGAAVSSLTGVDPDVVVEVVRELGNLLADIIIDRIAARIEPEPEKSPAREEIAPTRAPGRPRTDGAAPTRRRTAK